jgi:hypothetical protein
MQMDTRIPMMGVQPDFVGVIDSANQARARADEYAQANALRQYNQQYGQGVMAGDANALAGLARIDPFAAQTAQANAQQMTDNRTRMGYLSAQEQRAIESHAAQMSATERAQLREQGLTMLAPYAEANTPEEWYQVAKSQNQPEMADRFEERDRIFGQFIEADDIISRFDAANAPVDPMAQVEYAQAQTDLAQSQFDLKNDSKGGVGEFSADPQSAIAKLQQDLTNGLITQDQYELALQNMAPTGMRVTTDANGNTVIEQGPLGTGGGANLNVDQAKNAGFYERMIEAEQTIRPLEIQGTRAGQELASNAPFVGNFFLTPEFQQYEQAKADYIAALLRRESGAVIGPVEFADADRRYFPQPGDSPEVIKQKRDARLTVIQGVAMGAGTAPLSPMPESRPGPNNIPVTVTGSPGRPGVPVATPAPQPVAGLQNPQPGPNNVPPPVTTDISQMTLPDLLAFDLNTATVEEIKAWQDRFAEVGQ